MIGVAFWICAWRPAPNRWVWALAVQIIDPSIIAVAAKIVANLVIGTYLRLLFEIEEPDGQYRDFGTFKTDLVMGTKKVSA
jgi:hypothetical protein